MASKGSALSRTIRYFKEAELEEARYVFSRVGNIMRQRELETTSHPANVGTGESRKRRARKTKPPVKPLDPVADFPTANTTTAGA